jgi:hypothetical protein
MTLREWVEKLPEIHSARREYENLVRLVNSQEPETDCYKLKNEILIRDRNAALARLLVAVEALQLIADSSPADDMDGAPDCAREALRRIGPLPGEKP